MKLKRHKRVRKVLQFYTLSFGISPPYRVIVDPAFIQACRDGHIMIKEQLPSLFHAPATAFITPCILHWLQQRGGQTAAALHIASSLSFLSCRHGKKGKIHPEACIKSLLSHSPPALNPDKLIVAAQSPTLREWVRGRAGAPLLFVHGVVLVMEPPSGEERFDTTEKARQGMAAQLTADEQQAVQQLRAEEQAAQPQPLQRRRKKPKGPNPLSVRKKKTAGAAASHHQPQQQLQEQQAAVTGGKRKRESTDVREEQHSETAGTPSVSAVKRSRTAAEAETSAAS